MSFWCSFYGGPSYPSLPKSGVAKIHLSASVMAASSYRHPIGIWRVSPAKALCEKSRKAAPVAGDGWRRGRFSFTCGLWPASGIYHRSDEDPGDDGMMKPMKQGSCGLTRGLLVWGPAGSRAPVTVRRLAWLLRPPKWSGEWAVRRKCLFSDSEERDGNGQWREAVPGKVRGRGGCGVGGGGQWQWALIMPVSVPSSLPPHLPLCALHSQHAAHSSPSSYLPHPLPLPHPPSGQWWRLSILHGTQRLPPFHSMPSSPDPNRKGVKAGPGDSRFGMEGGGVINLK